MASISYGSSGHPERPGVQTRHNAGNDIHWHFAFAEAVNTYFFRTLTSSLLTAVSMLSAAIVIVHGGQGLEWFQLKLASCYLKNHSARSTLTPQAQVVGFAEPDVLIINHIPCYQNHPESIQMDAAL